MIFDTDRVLNREFFSSKISLAVLSHFSFSKNVAIGIEKPLFLFSSKFLGKIFEASFFKKIFLLYAFTFKEDEFP